MLTEEAGTERTLIDHQAERDTLRYVTESALEHAAWQLRQTSTCAGYTSLTSTAFGAHTYVASVSPTDGSPVSIVATGTLDNGLALTRTRQSVPAYGVPTTLVLQPGAEGKDTFIEGQNNHEDHNKENDKKLKSSTEAGKEYHTLLQFDLSSIPAGSAILSATLELTLSKMPANPEVIGIHRITRSWTEGGATWLTHNGSNDWDTPGGDYDAAQTSSFEASALGQHSADISALTQDWLDGTYPNHGILLVPEVTPGDDSNEFASGDDNDPSVRPKLTIVYACECGQTCAGPMQSPVAHWKLDETAGSMADDSEGDHDGQLQGNPDWVDGVVGGALDFDGSGDRVEAGAILETGTPEITIAAWVYKRDSGDDRVVSKSSSTSASDHVYSLGVSGTTIRVRLKTEDNGGTSDYDGGTLTLNEWTHLAFTYDGITLRIFKNGVLSAQFAVTGDVVASSLDTVIGNVNDSDNRHWNGLLDDVRIYNRALSASEIADLGDYLAVSSSAHWKLDDGSGLTAVDSVGGHDGTLISDPTWTDSGMLDGGLIFDGVDDYIEVPHTDTLSMTSGITIAAWIYNASPIFGGTYRILSKEAPGANDNYWLSLQATSLFFGVGGGFFSASATLLPDTWYHVAVTYDDDSNEVRFYVDGAPAGQFFSGNTLTPNTAPLRIGSNWQSGKFFLGTLDDVRLYDHALSPANIATLADPVEGTSSAHWPLDDGSGITAIDIAGSNTGTVLGGATWTTGKLAGALEFDGVDDYVDVGSFDVNGSGLTLAGWFNADTLANEGRIISKAQGTSDSDAWWQLSIRDQGGSQWLRLRVKAGGITTAFVDSTTPLATGDWHFAAGTYDSASGEMALYLDGALLGTTPHAVGGDLDVDATVPVWLGANGSPARFFDGTLDDIRVFNRALSLAEVSSLAGSSPGGPIAYWPLDETSGSTATDAVGGHDGTVSGALWDSGALRFDGSNDFVSVGHDNALTLLDQMTFSARIYMPSIGFSYQSILAKDDGGSNSNYWFGTIGDELEFGFWSGGSFLAVTTTNVNLATHTWYDVAVTYDANADDVRLYVDGTQVQSGSLGGSPTATSADLDIGRSPDGEYWRGNIDDLRIYNQVLVPDAVAGLATASSFSGCTDNLRDEFNTASFSGSDGSLDWSGDWIEVGESNGATSGDIRVTSDQSAYQLRIRDNDNGGEGVQRVADLSSFSAAALGLDYRRQGLDNSNDYVALYISANGTSGPWTELDRFAGAATDSGYQSVQYDISSYISSQTAIRLLSSSTNGGTDTVYFDNIEIRCQN